jgi:hypothetical protein
MREGFQASVAETVRQAGLGELSTDVGLTTALIEEIRIHKILDSQPVTDETAQEYLARYHLARALVDCTPVPADFNLGEELQIFHDEMVTTIELIDSAVKKY